MGIEFEKPIKLNFDASAAIGISNRVGSGKMRHTDFIQIWLQDKVGSREMVLNKVGTDSNLADALTKEVDTRHVGGVGMEPTQTGDRSRRRRVSRAKAGGRVSDAACTHL